MISRKVAVKKSTNGRSTRRERYFYIAIANALCLLLQAGLITNSSLGDFFQWITEESKLIQLSRDYIDNENGRLEKLKTYEEDLVEHAKLYVNEDELAWNPLAIYKAIKHLTVDLRSVKENMKMNNYEGSIAKRVTKDCTPLPDDHVLYGEVRNIDKLRKSSNLTVIDMIEGHLASNIIVRHALKPEDCFYIGKISSEKYDHETAIEWLMACEKKYENITMEQISRIIVLSSLFVGERELCRRAVQELLEDGYVSSLVDLNVKLSQDLGNVFGINSKIMSNKDAPFNLNNHTCKIWIRPSIYDTLEMFNICAGDYDHELAHPSLRCRFNHDKSPFLTIAPLKEEQLSRVPYITIFREVLYDSEIERLKAEAYPRLIPGKVMTKKGPKLDKEFRKAHSIFLSNLETDYLPLRNRLMDMSSLSINHALEGLQIIYYVPGGYIRVHGDFMHESDEVKKWGHRSAQATLYLNDGTLGGGTVFPRLRLNIPPVKGSIVIWTNMKVDGTEENLADHASCPNVYGEKIIGIQWFRMRNQNHWITRPEDKPTQESVPLKRKETKKRRRVS